MASLRYLNEKLSYAISKLTTGPGNVRERLYSVRHNILLLSSDGLPPELKKNLDWIQKKMTEKNQTEFGYDDGRSLRLMRNSTGSKIAEGIVDLQYKINDLIEAELNNS